MKLLIPLALLVLLTGCTQEDPPPQPTPMPATTPTTATSAPSVVPSSTLPAGIDQLVRFTVNGKAVTGPKGRIKVKRGDTIRLVITSSTADEVHVHTYDTLVPVKAGGTVNVDVKATIAGVFEVEMESSHVLVTKLQVQ